MTTNAQLSIQYDSNVLNIDLIVFKVSKDKHFSCIDFQHWQIYSIFNVEQKDEVFGLILVH